MLTSLLRNDVLLAAPALLGATLVRGDLTAQIVEVEAYRSDDPACHAYRRRTKRTEVMFGPPGIAYVYFSYGVHWMLNVVAHGPEDAAAILIRAAIPLTGLDTMRARRGLNADTSLLSGPGKLAQAFAITASDSGLNLLDPGSGDLRLEPAKKPCPHVLTGPRVGIAVGKWHDVPWRFMDGDAMKWLSRKP